jgi:hypothetical protein
MAFHGFVDVQRVNAGRIEAGQSHVTDDYQLEWIKRILKAFFQALLDLT